ncbi:phosphoethanolamine transferase [Rheinheimera soli]|uniref:Glucan phosphoethanolaminetransferase (Alkaline phosphatase superfamily) n=1 Tax=Rheinheimera soli TaxID=443616 RepID=A0ABU1VWY0_9GAMM|nr:phosphoethanolamine transferase [Rheinheimera soli]MDR7120231.1 glucan phosphoethanolaminetransferase (alkaline phosphatase superfamily) [Rheinheimera soli]
MNSSLLHSLFRVFGLTLFALVLLSPVLVQWPEQDFVPYLQWKLIAAVWCYLLVLSLFRSLWPALVLLLPAAVLVPQEVFYLLTYQKNTDAHVIAIVAETDLSEALGYLTGVGVFLALAVLAILLLWWYLVRSAWQRHWRWEAGVRPVVWLIGSGVLASLGWNEWQYQQINKAKQRSNPEENVFMQRPLPYSYEKFHATYPLNMLLALNEFAKQKQAVADVADSTALFKFSAKQTEVPQARQIYVLVIGETLRPDRLQLNGYNRATTPRLAGIKNVISFTDMVSPWAWTRMSVPVIISRKSPVDQRYFPTESSLVAAFKEAGFSTAWLSTQSPLGVHDSSIALHASEADQLQYLNPVGYKQEGFYDEILLPAVELVLKQNHARQLIVLHTLGSHFSYADRYPEAFDLFTPSGKGQAISMHNKKSKVLLNNAYDNSVAYTDFILFTLIKQLEQTQSISTLFYVSDHGENIFDGQCDKSGHGHNTERDYRVASLLWTSDEYNQLYPQKKALAEQRRQQPLMTSSIFHSLLDLADIQYPDQRLSRSWVNSEWRVSPRLLQQGLDFDKAKRVGVCQELKAPE